MRKSINARVIGQRLVSLDPKKPEVELVRIDLEFAPLEEGVTRRRGRFGLRR